MKLACKHCHKLYDEYKQRSDCPHLEFPKHCKLHDRANCGNSECTKGQLVGINRREEDAKSA